MQLSNSQKIAKLQELSDQLYTIYGSALPGEDFNKQYKKYPKLYKALVKADISLEKTMRSYLKDLANRIDMKVQWQEYNKRLYKASETIKGDTFTNNIDWQGEVVSLSVTFQGELSDVFGYGMADAQTELGVDAGLTIKESSAINWLRKYTFKLAKDITDTTKNQLHEALMQSLANNEDQIAATNRLNEVIDNPYRAAMIAHTEAIRAYAQGKLATGQEIGAQFKIWRNGQPGAEEICAELDNAVVPIDETFDSMLGPLDAPPAHPNCRCGMSISMTDPSNDPNAVTQDENVDE